MNGRKVDYRCSCIVTLCIKNKWKLFHSVSSNLTTWREANAERKGITNAETTSNVIPINWAQFIEIVLKCISRGEMWDLLSLPKPWGLQRCLLLWLRPLLSRSTSPEPAPPSESHYPVYRSRTLQQARDRKHRGKFWIFKKLLLRRNNIKNTTVDSSKNKIQF